MSRGPGIPKTGGRQKGGLNKTTPELREQLKFFLAGEWPEIKKSFAKLDGRTKIIAFTKLLPFIMPQFQSVNLNLSSMSEEDLEIILSKIREDVTNEPIKIG